MKVKDVEKWKFKIYSSRAKQCLALARVAFANGDYDGCIITAIHAAISAQDAFCVYAKGQRYTGTDHREAVEFFKVTNPASEDLKAAARHIYSLISIKTDAEYGERAMRGEEAELALKHAERFVMWVEGKTASVL